MRPLVGLVQSWVCAELRGLERPDSGGQDLGIDAHHVELVFKTLLLFVTHGKEYGGFDEGGELGNTAVKLRPLVDNPLLMGLDHASLKARLYSSSSEPGARVGSLSGEELRMELAASSAQMSSGVFSFGLSDSSLAFLYSL